MTASTQLMETQMSKLTPTQLTILSHAVAHQSGALLPLPEALNLNNAAAARVFRSLIKRGLVEERDVGSQHPVWRDDGGKRIGLFATNQGIDMINAARQTMIGQAKQVLSSTAPSKTTPSKQSVLLQLLSQAGGVTLEELMAGSQWQAHSVRGFISGTVKRKLGLEVLSSKDDTGVRRYALANGETVQ